MKTHHANAQALPSKQATPFQRFVAMLVSSSLMATSLAPTAAMANSLPRSQPAAALPAVVPGDPALRLSANNAAQEGAWNRLSDAVARVGNDQSGMLKRGQAGLDLLQVGELESLSTQVLQDAQLIQSLAAEAEQRFAQDAELADRHAWPKEIKDRIVRERLLHNERYGAFQAQVIALSDAKRKQNLQLQRDALGGLAKVMQGWSNAKSFIPISKEAFQRERAPIEARNPIEDGATLHRSLAAASDAKSMASAKAALAPPTADDLAATDDVVLNAEIRALAQSLGNNPVQIYNWVRNNIEYLPTHGSMQGAALTLLNKRGNAIDTSSLLLSLLRAAGIPSRYVYGTVQVPIAQASNWIGGATKPEMVPDLMSKGGIPVSSVISGGVLSAVRFEHVWVEAYVDFYPSRGAINRTPDTWVPLDASFKQYNIVSKIDIQAGAPINVQGVLAQMDAGATKGANGSVTGFDLNIWDQAVTANREPAFNYANSVRPGAQLRDAVGYKTIIATNEAQLAGTLPYRLITLANRYSTLPSTLQHLLSISYYASEADFTQGVTSLTYTMPLAKVGISTIGADYVPATSADEQVINQARRDNAQRLSPYLVNLIPQVQIEGRSVAAGPPVRMGTQQYWKAEILDPFGRFPPNASANKAAAGSHLVFGINAAGVTADMVQRRLDLIPEGKSYPLREGLQQAGMQFWMVRDHYDQIAAATFNGNIVRMPSVGTFSAPLQVNYSFGVPQTSYFNGYQTDIKRSIYAATAPTTQEQVAMFTMAGMAGSMLEGVIWEALLNFPLGSGVSTARIIGLANERKIPIHMITGSNLAAVLPTLQISSFAKQEISNAVNAGMRVLVPEQEVTIGSWKGSGYVIQDPETGAGIYQIDGGLSGGQLLLTCLLKAILESCEFQKFLAKWIKFFLKQLWDKATKSALLAPAGLAFATAAALSANALFFMAFHRAITDFTLFMVEEDVFDIMLAAAICSYTGPCSPFNGKPKATGNPVLPATGEKLQFETDFVGAGGNPIVFSRTYLSQAPKIDSPMGRKWRHSYDRSIKLPPPTVDTDAAGAPIGNSYTVNLDLGQRASAIVPANPPAPQAVLAVRGDGSYFQFNLRGNNYVANSDIPEAITREVDGSGRTTGWVYRNALDETERYNAEGKLASITTRTGMVQTLTYGGDGQLAQIRDHFNRTARFTYNAAGNLETLTDPAGNVWRYTYDDWGNLETVTHGDGKLRRYHYEQGPQQSLLTGITDETGKRFSTYRYDFNGRVKEEIQAGGANRMTFNYVNDLKTEVTDALGATRTYEFQKVFELKKLLKVSEPCTSCGGSNASQISYDSAGFEASLTDFNGNRTTFTRDARGLEKTRTEAQGTAVARTVTIDYDPVWRVPTQVIEPIQGGSRTTIHVLDAQGNIKEKKVTAPNAAGVTETRIWKFDYNANGQQTLEDGPRSDVADTITTTYTPTGDVETVTDAAGNVTRYEDYDPNGRVRKITDPNGLITRLTYDGRGRLKSSDAGGELTTYSYDGVGNLDRLTLPDGSYLQYGYDDAQRLAGITDSLGNKVTYTLDDLGNRKKEDTTDPAGTLAQTLARGFDTLGRLREQLGSTAAQQTLYTYDSQGNVKSIRDPLLHVTVNDYDELNRLKKVTEPQLAGETAAGAIQYTYDPQDNLATVTDQRNLTTRYDYSGFDELKRLTSPDTGVATYGYDAAGNVKTMQDARGITATYSYDGLNRLKSLIYPDESLSFTYGDEAGAPAESTNSKGRLAQVTDGSGSTTYGYDLQGRVTQKRQVTGSVTRTVGYGYNPAGQLQTLTTPSGQSITYSYGNNQITGLQINGAPLLSEAKYFPFGEVKSWTWGSAGSGTSYQRVYDTDGRIASVTLGGTTRGYGFDDASRITGLTDKQGSTTTSSTTVGYDELDRLTSATATSAQAFSQTFTYDLIGNRKTQTEGGVSSTLVYDPTSNRLTSQTGAQPATYGYDAVGNLTSDASFTYTYSGRNRLTEVKSGTTVTASYRHNAFGERVSKAQGGALRIYAYDEDGHLLGEYDSQGNLIQETVWLEDTPVATLMPTSPGQPIGASNPLKVYRIWADHLDTPRAITTHDNNNSLVWSWNSDPFGTTLPQSAGGFEYNLRFPGQYYDSETGFHYNYFRDYNPKTGRYVQSDPVGVNGGLNTYKYVNASPIVYFDLLGKSKATPRQKTSAKSENQKFNCGKCEWCGVKMQPSVKSTKGVPTNPNSVNVDHIVEQRFGGCNEHWNHRCLCAYCNQQTRNGDLFNTVR